MAFIQSPKWRGSVRRGEGDGQLGGAVERYTRCCGKLGVHGHTSTVLKLRRGFDDVLQGNGSSGGDYPPDLGRITRLVRHGEAALSVPPPLLADLPLDDIKQLINQSNQSVNQ